MNRRGIKSTSFYLQNYFFQKCFYTKYTYIPLLSTAKSTAKMFEIGLFIILCCHRCLNLFFFCSRDLLWIRFTLLHRRTLEMKRHWLRHESREPTPFQAEAAIIVQTNAVSLDQKSSLFQALGQWERSRKRARDERDLVKKKLRRRALF